MFWGPLHRTILYDLFKIFSISLITLTSLILLAGVVSEAMKNGLGPMQILTLIPLLTPSMIPYTVPATTLFTTCMVYGRLAADNEILALKAAGIHVIHVVWPALFLGAVASALTMFLSMDAIPRTQFYLKTQVASDVEEMIYTMLRKDGFFKHYKSAYEIYVKHMDGRIMRDMQFMRRAEGSKCFDLISRAREAELHVDLVKKQLLLEMRHCDFVQNNGTLGFVESRVWPIDLPGDLNGTYAKARASEMTWSELAVYRARLEQKKHDASHDIDAHQMALRFGAPSSYAEHVRNKNNERKVIDSQIFALDSEYHMRTAFALGCWCFALVGCPIGIWFSRTDYLSAFVTCFLPIVTIYYPIMFCMINMSHAGKIPPWLGIYNADLLMVIAGTILFRRMLMR